MKIANLKSVKADSIATVELSQVRVEYMHANDIVQTTETIETAF
jgi:hypothetical protein